MKKRNVTEIGKPYKKWLGQRLPMSARNNDYAARVDVAVFDRLNDSYIHFIKQNFEYIEHEVRSPVFHVFTIRCSTGAPSSARISLIKSVLHMCGLRYDKNVCKDDPLRRDLVMWDSVGESGSTKSARLKSYYAAFESTLDVWIVEAFGEDCNTPYLSAECYSLRKAQNCKKMWKSIGTRGTIKVRPAPWIKNHPALQ